MIFDERCSVFNIQLFDHQTWEARYVLLLWLSIVCMIPFDMARFDGLKEAVTGAVERRRPVVDRILETAKVNLNSQRPEVSEKFLNHVNYSVYPCTLLYILQKSHVTL